MKWILLLLALAGGGFFVYHQRNSVKVSYVNGLPQYSALPGKEFLFQQDCYIFKQVDADTVYPLVASHQQLPSLPPLVEEAHLGKTQNGVRLLATARVGDRIKLISVRREESRTGQLISFELLFVDENERPYPRLDARLILDHTPEKDGLPPTFLPEILVPRIKG
jgi:hypothetical protein